MRYLLDTNIVSDLVRTPQGKVARHIRTVGEKPVCTSIIVAAELRYGADKKGSPRLSSQLDAVLGALEVLPFESPADTSYGSLRTRLEKRGTPIGANDLLNNDLLIAAQALALGYVMVTDNEKEFSRVEGLRLQNWLRSTE
jgi:tRNA(fMet)-specific endonuclease VapC